MGGSLLPGPTQCRSTPATTHLMTRPSTKQYEARIARNFCRALGHGWTLIAQPDPPEADCLIQGHGEPVAVELCRYRQQGVENEFHEANSAFQAEVCEAWLSDSTVNETSLNLSYAEDRRRPKIPRPHERPTVIQQLKLLARDPAFIGHKHVEVGFTRGDDADMEYQGARAYYCVATCRYPVLEHFFGGVHLSRHPGLRLGYPHTSADSLFVGLDREHVGRMLREKVARLATYREAGHPVWLLAHSDGWPGSACLPELHLDEALKIASSEVADFDAAYWLDDALSDSGGRLYRLGN